jgi:hypothetical protein
LKNDGGNTALELAENTLLQGVTPELKPLT